MEPHINESDLNLKDFFFHVSGIDFFHLFRICSNSQEEIIKSSKGPSINLVNKEFLSKLEETVLLITLYLIKSICIEKSGEVENGVFENMRESIKVNFSLFGTLWDRISKKIPVDNEEDTEELIKILCKSHEMVGEEGTTSLTSTIISCRLDKIKELMVKYNL